MMDVGSAWRACVRAQAISAKYPRNKVANPTPLIDNEASWRASQLQAASSSSATTLTVDHNNRFTDFTVGDVVMVTGVVGRRAQFNGSRGTVLRADSSSSSSNVHNSTGSRSGGAGVQEEVSVQVPGVHPFGQSVQLPAANLVLVQRPSPTSSSTGSVVSATTAAAVREIGKSFEQYTAAIRKAYHQAHARKQREAVQKKRTMTKRGEEMQLYKNYLASQRQRRRQQRQPSQVLSSASEHTPNKPHARTTHANAPVPTRSLPTPSPDALLSANYASVFGVDATDWLTRQVDWVLRPSRSYWTFDNASVVAILSLIHI